MVDGTKMPFSIVLIVFRETPMRIPSGLRQFLFRALKLKVANESFLVLSATHTKGTKR